MPAQASLHMSLLASDKYFLKHLLETAGSSNEQIVVPKGLPLGQVWCGQPDYRRITESDLAGPKQGELRN